MKQQQVKEHKAGHDRQKQLLLQQTLRHQCSSQQQFIGTTEGLVALPPFFSFSLFGSAFHANMYIVHIFIYYSSYCLKSSENFASLSRRFLKELIQCAFFNNVGSMFQWHATRIPCAKSSLSFHSCNSDAYSYKIITN